MVSLLGLGFEMPTTLAVAFRSVSWCKFTALFRLVVGFLCGESTARFYNLCCEVELRFGLTSTKSENGTSGEDEHGGSEKEVWNESEPFREGEMGRQDR